MARARYQGPAFLSHGFRPFFLGAGVVAFLLVPVWLWLFLTGQGLPSGMAPLDWHRHEMILGYLGAVVTGFLLTAIPNWTGRLPLSGKPLLALFLLWVAGRVALLLPLGPMGAVTDSLFLPVVAFFAGREVVAGKNWRNLPVAVFVGLFALANILFHLEAAGVLATAFSVRAALGVLILLISLIGGRIVPSFTTNWLIKSGASARPVPFGPYDKTVLVLTGLALGLWVCLPDGAVTAASLLTVAVLQAVRLWRWKVWAVGPSAIVLVLHVAYAWLPVGLALLAASDLLPPKVAPSQSAGVHALTAGLMAMMTVAVMTRATLGHTGRALAAGRAGTVLYGLLFLAAVTRVAAPLVAAYEPLLMASATFWSLAFLLFTLHFGSMMLRPRAGG
ncbi:NnrS family protein [Kordiimonas marina]|uniref:NnrS family protein n=1 Tax=Kordiimonas marina TaxID=2872312 RepID=UPI001FF3A44F|nr:NnrS family protein [Kordiimonas marina]MCJ9428202.1 NnrS family protein [Kordiimonas marina]